jgi:hypothetical protein
MGDQDNRRTEKVTELDPHGYAEALEGERRRTEASELPALMTESPGRSRSCLAPTRSGSGPTTIAPRRDQDGELFKVGFSPRRDRVTLSVMSGRLR